jgi:hypothetical protein
MVEEPQHSQPISAEPNREISPVAPQINISEDERFKGLVAEAGSPGSQDAQMIAMDRFQEQFPDDYSAYETNSIWYDADGNPDIRGDLFYNKLEGEIEARIKDKLLGIDAENADPDVRLISMAQSYERTRFETAKDAFQDYKARFPGKTQTYTDSNIGYNQHQANFDEYANNRLQNIPDKYNATALAFYKAIVANSLGNDSPKVSREKISREFYGALAADMGRENNVESEWKKKLKEWLEKLVA